MMVSHRAVDQFKGTARGLSGVFTSQTVDESQLLNWSTAIWDAIIVCQGWYVELSVNHLVTRRPPRSEHATDIFDLQKKDRIINLW